MHVFNINKPHRLLLCQAALLLSTHIVTMKFSTVLGALAAFTTVSAVKVNPLPAPPGISLGATQEPSPSDSSSYGPPITVASRLLSTSPGSAPGSLSLLFNGSPQPLKLRFPISSLSRPVQPRASAQPVPSTTSTSPWLTAMPICSMELTNHTHWRLRRLPAPSRSMPRQSGARCTRLPLCSS